MRPLSRSFPLIDIPASEPWIWAAVMAASCRRASVDVPGPAKTWPPQLSQ